MAKKSFFLHRPEREGDLGNVLLMLWHGAGGDVDNAHIMAMAKAFSERGAHAVRARFPYRIEGRKPPDRMPKLVKAAEDTIEEVKEEIGQDVRLFLGGRSMGGRVASMLVADGYPADGLIFLSYPLHPAGKKDKLRDEHLYRIEAPMLFLTGDRDALADMALLRPVVDKLGDRATVEIWPGADHSFRKVDPGEVNDRTLGWLPPK